MAQIFAKFDKNERLVSFGAAIVIIGWLLGVFSAFGFGYGILTAIGAVAVLVLYYLKYAPNQNIQWPIPIETLVLGISGIIAIVAVLNLIQILGLLSIAGYFGLYLIALLAITAGGVVMAFGAWTEFQATAAARAAAAPPVAPPAVPPAASSAPPAAPPAPPAPPAGPGEGNPPA